MRVMYIMPLEDGTAALSPKRRKQTFLHWAKIQKIEDLTVEMLKVEDGQNKDTWISVQHSNSD